jgi:hypothetical protein
MPVGEAESAIFPDPDGRDLGSSTQSGTLASSVSLAREIRPARGRGSRRHCGQIGPLICQTVATPARPVLYGTDFRTGPTCLTNLPHIAASSFLARQGGRPDQKELCTISSRTASHSCLANTQFLCAIHPY